MQRQVHNMRDLRVVELVIGGSIRRDYSTGATASAAAPAAAAAPLSISLTALCISLARRQYEQVEFKGHQNSRLTIVAAIETNIRPASNNGFTNSRGSAVS